MIANLLLLIAETWVLGQVALVLHYRSARMGSGPLFMFNGCLATIVAAQLGVFIEPSPGIILFISSSVYIPTILTSVLVLYVAEGANRTRRFIWGVLGVSLLFVMAQAMYRAHLLLPGGGTFVPVRAEALVLDLDLRVVAASLIAFGADMLVIAIFYQGMKNNFPRMSEWITIGLSFLASLWTDVIIFHIVADLGREDFIALLPGDLIAKTFSGLILWPLVAYYLVRVAPNLPGHLGAQDRSTFDLLLGSVDRIKLALVNTREELSSEREKVRELHDLVGEATHDLKAPLSALNLKIYALSKTEDMTKRQRHLDDLAELSKRMNTMIDDLLTLARLENHQEFSPVPVDVNQMIQDTYDYLRPTAEQKNLTISLDFGPVSDRLHGDDLGLARAIANLIENAMRYTPDGGEVRIKTELKNQDIVVCVADTGIGIPDEDQSKIFNRFYRASNTRSEIEGTGLGLVIVRKVVEQHGGRIDVTSKVGQGTTFMVYFPITHSN
jgi:signal transduction histidine kinase